MNITGEKLIDLLIDVADMIRKGDSLEGSLRYEATETPNLYEVTASLRTGNRDGQGGVRIIPADPTQETNSMPLQEHMAWVRDRVLEELGDEAAYQRTKGVLAITSAMSDLNKIDGAPWTPNQAFDWIRAGLDIAQSEPCTWQQVKDWILRVEAEALATEVK